MEELLEKHADELIELFYSVNEVDDKLSGTSPYLSRLYARECAILHCENIINVLDKLNKLDSFNGHIDSESQYYSSLVEYLKKM